MSDPEDAIETLDQEDAIETLDQEDAIETSDQEDAIETSDPDSKEMSDKLEIAMISTKEMTFTTEM